MDVGRAFKFMFDDPRWPLKLLIGGFFAVGFGSLQFLLPDELAFVGQIISLLGGLVLTGYTLLLIRRVADGDDFPLPEWNDIGGYFRSGLKAFVVQLGWSVPLILVAFLAGLAAFFGAATGGGRGLVLFGGLIFLVAVAAVVIVAPAGLGRLAVTGSIREGLNFRFILGMVRGNLGDYLLLFALFIAVGLIALLGFLVFVVGALFTVPYAYLVVAHLTGQAYFRSTSTLPVVAATGRPYLEP